MMGNEPGREHDLLPPERRALLQAAWHRNEKGDRDVERQATRFGVDESVIYKDWRLLGLGPGKSKTTPIAPGGRLVPPHTNSLTTEPSVRLDEYGDDDNAETSDDGTAVAFNEEDITVTDEVLDKVNDIWASGSSLYGITEGIAVFADDDRYPEDEDDEHGQQCLQQREEMDDQQRALRVREEIGWALGEARYLVSTLESALLLLGGPQTATERARTKHPAS